MKPFLCFICSSAGGQRNTNLQMEKRWMLAIREVWVIHACISAVLSAETTLKFLHTVEVKFWRYYYFRSSSIFLVIKLVINSFWKMIFNQCLFFFIFFFANKRFLKHVLQEILYFFILISHLIFYILNIKCNYYIKITFKLYNIFYTIYILVFMY